MAKMQIKRERAAVRALERKSASGWDTSDVDEIARRVERAATEPMKVTNLEPREPFYSTFAVVSGTSGLPYQVEIRSLVSRRNSCTCPDFRVNGLGTCKHIERVSHELRKQPALFKRAAAAGSPRAEIYLRREGEPSVYIALPPKPANAVSELAAEFFDATGRLRSAAEDGVPALERAIAALRPPDRRAVRLADEVKAWAADRARTVRRSAERAAFEQDLKAGKRTIDMVRYSLYDYQVEGMLHLAFGERTMLVDDMGLGKTVQAIAACALLKELRGIQRVLVVSPASLKTEWEEQIRKFTGLPLQLILGPQHERREQYRRAPFFSLANYEQVLRDVREINESLAPDVVILDEAQRIKNWSTKTAQAVKRLASPYAFVLTGTPLENRIDEVYSITEFLDPGIFGPLFRFNREFYALDERGRPAGYKNLSELRRRIRPIMLRRRKDEVEDQLPERVDNNYFVEMSPEQHEPYTEYERRAAALIAMAQRRPLLKAEHERLQRILACMRMLCDTPYILDPETRVCPKLGELESVLVDLGVTNGRKAIVFSEWERMLQLVRDLSKEMGLGFAWHTGSVPQHKRREDINRFKEDPNCKLFLSTDSGGLGLNLQAASAVINLDLPWNPAKLEQRIARAWRKHQKNVVHVVNLITKNSIEHRMLATLAVKRDLADGVIDGRGDLASLRMTSGRQSFLDRLNAIMGADVSAGSVAERRAAIAPATSTLDPRDRFRQDLLAQLSARVYLIEVHPQAETAAEAALVVVDKNPEQVAEVARRLHQDAYGAAGGAVEVVDRATYETIQRLAQLGLVTFATGPGQQVHVNPALAAAGPTPQEKRHKRATELSVQAEKKLRMAKILADGGFAQEGLVPARDAAEFAVRALALLAGHDVAGEQAEPVSMTIVCNAIVTGGFLSSEDAAQVAALREVMSVAGETADEKTSSGLIRAGACIVDKTIAALARHALGPGASLPAGAKGRSA